MTVFALIDHSGEAEKVGLKMRPTQLLIFGSPKGGTPLMVAAPRLAIDLPLKALAWQDEQGQGVALLQFAGVSAAAAWLSRRPAEKHRGIAALIQKAVE